MPELPQFIIIGAMKCATSSLYEQLARQPGIFMTVPKEPNFFSDQQQFDKGLDWYRALFREAPSDSLCGEASTHYSKLPNYPMTIQRINESVNHPRFIYLMRDPIDRLLSHYIHEWSTSGFRCNLQQAIERYPELVDYGLYAMQLRPYIETFGRDSICPVFFDHWVNSPQVELERICRFIGYRASPKWISELAPSNVSSERIRRFPLYGPLIESSMASYLRTKFVPRGLRQWVKSKLRMQAKPELSAALKRELCQRFDADLAVLGSWLGIDLNCTNFKRQTGRSILEWAPDHER